MAKKGRRTRRKFNLRRVRVSPALPMLTTGSKLALSVDVAGAADGAYRAISLKGTWNLRVLTAGDGPLICGFAFGDYTDVEIEEAIEASAAISVGDAIAQEKADRRVRIVGQLNEGNLELLDGKPVSTKLNWLIPIGKTVKLFVYNDGVALTTGAVVSFNGDMWVKDST